MEVKYITQKSLGKKFGLSSKKIGEVLSFIGLKKPYGEVSEEAKMKGIAKNFGESFYYKNTYKWNEEKVTDYLLKKTNLKLATKEEKEMLRREKKIKSAIKEAKWSFDNILGYNNIFDFERVLDVYYHCGLQESNFEIISLAKDYLLLKQNEKRFVEKGYQEVLNFFNGYLDNKEEVDNFIKGGD